MIYVDTFQVANTFARLPDQHILDYYGWQPLINRHSGGITSYYLNFGKDEGKPRLTLAKNRNDWWNLYAEVSSGRWLFGSNLRFLTKEEFKQCLDHLSELVEANSGIAFDANKARVTRADFASDFQVGEQAVIPILNKYSKFELSRYERVCYGDTSVYFNNGGKVKNKQYKLYSKYHERLSKRADAYEIEEAKGLIRLEISVRKNAVNRLAKSLKLKSHHANHLLTEEVSQRVIGDAKKLLHFGSLFNAENHGIERLFETLGSATAFNRLGYLHLKMNYGKGITDLPFVNVSPKTLKRYEEDCRKAGIMSLE